MACPKKFNEKKGADGLWLRPACVPSALLLSALNFFLFDHGPTETAYNVWWRQEFQTWKYGFSFEEGDFQLDSYTKVGLSWTIGGKFAKMCAF